MFSIFKVIYPPAYHFYYFIIQIVSGAVYPWVLSLLESIFDPLCRAQCKCFADLVSQLLDYDLPEDKSNMLLQKVFAKFNAQLKMFCLPILRSNADVNSYSFLISQLWHLNVCLGNLFLFRNLLSPIALSRLMWNLFTSEWCRAIVSVLNFSATNCNVSPYKMTIIFNITV